MDTVLIDKLIENQESKKIYDHTPPYDLIHSIKNNGVLQPIWITEEGKIISGHRRVNACKQLSIEEIPYEIKEDSLLLILEANRYRNKNCQEIMNEVKVYEEILKEKARKKQSNAGGDKKSEKYKENKKIQESLCQNSDKAIAPVDIKKEIAKAVGVSHDTYAKMKVINEKNSEAFKKIDKGESTIHREYQNIKKKEKKEKINHQSQKSIITCNINDLNELINKGIKCKTIYADPPWQYSNQATRSATDLNYMSMTIEQLMALPIKEIADKEAHLHLWTTNAFLFESKKILEAWGFVYKSIFVWVKPIIGIGNYWRVSHEFLILGVKENLQFMDNSIRSWEEIERRKHSEKPEEIRQKIEKVSPGPRLELFGRKPVDGWIVWGNEIQKKDFLKKLDECI